MLDRLIDHAALFPPASMPLDVALEEDRAARESEAAALINRFVVPARLLQELPEERPALSVVLSEPEDAALLPGTEGVEAVELRCASPRPRPADLLATYRALEPLGVEIYFELVFDEGWRDERAGRDRRDRGARRARQAPLRGRRTRRASSRWRS